MNRSFSIYTEMLRNVYCKYVKLYDWKLQNQTWAPWLMTRILALRRLRLSYVTQKVLEWLEVYHETKNKKGVLGKATPVSLPWLSWVVTVH